MSPHTKSIIIFGIILPGGILMALLIGSYTALNRLQESKSAKTVAFEEHQKVLIEVEAIESRLEGKRDLMAYWDENLDKEFIQELSQNLTLISERFTDEQLRQTALSRPANRSPLAGLTKNRHSRFRLSFEGGFGPMQEALASLEMAMPQIVLEELKVQLPPNATGEAAGPALMFDVTYLCWQD